MNFTFWTLGLLHPHEPQRLAQSRQRPQAHKPDARSKLATCGITSIKIDPVKPRVEPAEIASDDEPTGGIEHIK